MRLRALTVGAALVSACYSGNVTPGGGSSDGGSMDAGPTDMPDSGPISATGLPCDVATLVFEKCVSCHYDSPSAPSALVLTSYSAFTADSAEPGMTVAQLAVARMRDTADPMPPSPATPAGESEIGVLEAWIADGYPRGTCEAPDAGPDPYDTPTVCTSNSYWRGGNEESPNMHPGVACINCHEREGEGPRFRVAGTVYPTAHEPNDCNGTRTATIVITDANGIETRLTSNLAGNFYATTRNLSLALPYQAKVVFDGRERVMVGEQTDGDCNTCHTTDGTERAPGRIMLP